MLTCHRFHRIIKYCNNLWKLEVKVKDMLLSLSSKCFPVGEPSITDAQNFNCDKYPSLKGIENVLQNHVFSDRLNENMTSRFYARKVLKSLRYQKIEKKLGELMGLPESKTSLLEGAVLICQWAQAEEANPISLSNVKQRLSEISNQVKELLVDRHNIADPLNITTGTAEKVLHCINEVLYEEMRFKVMQSNHTLENVFIDKVLESKAGFPMTLCIIYREVALRMGIDCEPVIAVTTRPDFHSHRFLLRWRENSNLNQGTDENNCLIDAPNGGVMRHHNPATYPLISAENFLLRMVEYMRFIRMHSIRASRREDFRTLSRLRRQNELSFSRLAYAVSSKQIQKAAFYAHLCIDLDMPLDDAIQILQRIDNVRCNRLMENCVIKAKEQAIVRKRNVQFRLPCIKYAVGLVMAYKSSTNTSPVFCVIIWWTNNGKNRTRYNVLFDGGDSSLVPEETLNLLTTGSNIVDHPNIGIYFKRYDGRRYIPNIELMTLYPEDEAFALSLMT
ncbi:F-box only protein 21-like [Daphnia carinata]|uniref:F-box only protein 21-like n=1 Tax=Daphnia carinata TaxID=120202 RepID=UPI002579CFCD|nr:F-box only protein 21-like [Daphnia carinata]